VLLKLTVAVAGAAAVVATTAAAGSLC